MPSILEEFAYGNLSPEAPCFKRDPAYGRAVECVSGSGRKLLERLGAEDKKVFQAYADMQDELNRLTAVNNLIYGFKLGLLMTAESFLGMEELYLSGDNL